MNPFGGGQLEQVGSSGVDGDRVDHRPNEISSSSGGVGVVVDSGGPINVGDGGMDRATVSSMLLELRTELEEKFEKRMTEEMAKEREARKEMKEVFEDCIEKLMEELCQVALIVTGKREDDDDPSRPRENITKRLGKLYRDLRVKFGKWKGDDESWETPEEMYAGIKRELGLENSKDESKDAVQDKSVDVPVPRPVVPGESSSVPDTSETMSTSSRSNVEEGEEEALNDGDQPSVVRGESVLTGAPDPRPGPPYLRLHWLDPAILAAKNAQGEGKETLTSGGRRATSARSKAKPHSTRNQQKGMESKVGGSRYIQTRQSGSDNRPFQCPRCPARFKLKQVLTQHMVVHSDRKPFKCSKCPARFKHSRGMKSHMLQVHSNRRRFKCQICGAGFKLNCHLTTHLRLHTGERPYSCHICNKAFSDSSYWKRHVRTHLGEEGKIYQCPFCSMKFVCSSSCRGHQRRLHKSELAPAASKPGELKKKKGQLKTQQTAKVGDQPESQRKSTGKK